MCEVRSAVVNLLFWLLLGYVLRASVGKYKLMVRWHIHQVATLVTHASPLILPPPLLNASHVRPLVLPTTTLDNGRNATLKVAPRRR